jgi:cell cycle checkpoint control protein RAD9A
MDLQLVLTALNSSKSAYASFSLDATVFFEKYNFNPSTAKGRQSLDDDEARFTCQLYNKVRLHFEDLDVCFEVYED